MLRGGFSFWRAWIEVAELLWIYFVNALIQEPGQGVFRGVGGIDNPKPISILLFGRGWIGVYNLDQEGMGF